jgi:flagellar biogenesis protein FliO
MIAAGFVDLFVRMVTSLALVLAIIAIAYVVMRRRAGSTPRIGRTPASPSGSSMARRGERSPRAARRNHRQPIEVIGRIGLSRSSAAVAVKFGDRVILVGASEQSPPTVLAEVDAATWELSDPGAEWSVPADIVEASDHGALVRPNFIDALREATVRRA